MKIAYLELHLLSMGDQKRLQEISTREIIKIERLLKNKVGELLVHVKTMETTGHRCKYSVHLKIEDPSCSYSVRQADWDIATAAHKTFDNLRNTIEHKIKKDVLKKENQRRKVIRSFKQAGAKVYI